MVFEVSNLSRNRSTSQSQIIISNFSTRVNSFINGNVLYLIFIG